MLPSTLRTLCGRVKSRSLGPAESQLVLSSVRAFRADSPDAEACGEGDGVDKVGSSSAISDSPKRSSGEQSSDIDRSRLASNPPIRASQQPPNEGERRKVLTPSHDEFTGNVATLLVRWPHLPTQPSKQPRSWREVVDNDRFMSLFPRRPTALTQHAIRNLQATLAATAEGLNEAGGSGSAAAGGPGPQQDPAAHAVVSELLERLMAVQQRLQDSMSEDDDGSGESTILAVAAIAEEDDEDDLSNGHDASSSGRSWSQQASYDDEDAEMRRGAHAQGFAASASGLHSSSSSGQETATGAQPDGGSEGASGSRRLGRRLRWNPCPRRGPIRTPAPPWDDCQPFQTHVGTVYHFWRLCPYG
ncbi:hypothetical protein Agub_g11637 [Astrephomene gubernaculifera]|uniref:Uncharacterized protein n=1 Tax=Astrephomene gubernaculifera TaxID=47775 RepID=A0AAD3DYY1_9CHLO|nr:hypothetical protein Agub_g11637 [Astrephomene gubernaculifera]